MSQKSLPITWNCPACGHQPKGPFCEECGQQKLAEPTSSLSLLSDYARNVLSLQRSVPKTILSLIKDPRYVVEAYLQGYRGRYASPGKLLFYALTLLAIHVAYLGTEILGLQFDIDGVRVEYIFWVLVFILLIICSVVSLAWHKAPLVRHLISVSYLSCAFLMPFLILYDLLIWISDDLKGPWIFLVYIMLFFGWNARVFGPTGKLWVPIVNVIAQVACMAALIALLMFLTS